MQHGAAVSQAAQGPRITVAVVNMNRDGIPDALQQPWTGVSAPVQ